MNSPFTRAAYTAESRNRVVHAAAVLAETLGELADRAAVVGGLVPTALEELRVLDVVAEPHMGTLDLDVALAVALGGTESASEVERRVVAAHFRPVAGRNPDGAWRWVSDAEPGVLLEFLVDSDDARAVPGSVVPVSGVLGALAARGMRLALRNPLRWELRPSAAGSRALTVSVCAPAPFIVLKALAVDGREPGKPKDSYDLDHVLRNSRSRAALAADLAAFSGDDRHTVRDAMDAIRTHFGREDARGPRDLATFLEAGDDPGLRADCVGFALDLVAAWDRARRR